ncbi:MAG: hypothetical protein FJW36_16695 [Acidobacteria bacterium]|nr:hypothetical protein [Acidobacteriota bacterium]
MKLRLRANTIRLRLLEHEVARLASGSVVSETVPTPRPFHYEVVSSSAEDLIATFDQDTLRVEVPSAWAVEWATNDVVGRQAKTAGLDILIEKDWACTTPRQGEANDGTYPNPTALT